MRNGLIILGIVILFASQLVGFEPFSQKKVRTVAERDSTRVWFVVDANDDLVSRLIRELQDSVRVLDESLDALEDYRDSNYIQWGVDTSGAYGFVTTVFAEAYDTTNYIIIITPRSFSPCDSVPGWVSNPMNSLSFLTQFACNDEVVFQWMTVGIK